MKTENNYSDEELLRRRQEGRLPVIQIAGAEFTVHWEQRELRMNVDPKKTINLDGLELMPEGREYFFYYHLPSREVVPIYPEAKQLPKDTVMVVIPYELWLDPVGVARLHKMADDALLNLFPIRERMEAKVIALEQSPIGLKVRANQQAQQNKPGLFRRLFKQKKRGKGL